MTLKRCEVDGELGWQWEDGACYVGANAMLEALQDGATRDPDVFANIAYEVVTASSDVKWAQVPDDAEVLHLD